jgi:hypothetical protein
MPLCRQIGITPSLGFYPDGQWTLDGIRKEKAAKMTAAVAVSP